MPLRRCNRLCCVGPNTSPTSAIETASESRLLLRVSTITCGEYFPKGRYGFHRFVQPIGLTGGRHNPALVVLAVYILFGCLSRHALRGSCCSRTPTMLNFKLKVNPDIKLVFMSTHAIDESKYFGEWEDTLEGYKRRDPAYLEPCKLKV